MVYLFLADGFEEMEALVTVDMLRRAKVEVTTVGVGKLRIIGAHNICVTADVLDVQCDFSDMDAVILPGGMPGTLHLEQSFIVQRTLDTALQYDVLIAAICAAPSILGKRGMLRGKCATCFPEFEQFLDGADVITDSVVVDSHIITAKGAGVAIEFAYAIITALCGEECAKNVKEAMQCK